MRNQCDKANSKFVECMKKEIRTKWGYAEQMELSDHLQKDSMIDEEIVIEKTHLSDVIIRSTEKGEYYVKVRIQCYSVKVQ